MSSTIEKTWELYKKIISTQDSEEWLAIFRKVHNALRREPGSILSLLSQLFPIGQKLDGNCKVALCRMIEEIVGRGLVPEEIRAEVLSMCIEEFCRIINSPDIYVQKRIMRSCAALYPQTLSYLYTNPDVDLWKKVCNLKLGILSFMQHENAGLLEYVIRFMHCIILIQLKRDVSVTVLASDKLCLDNCPLNHTFLHQEELEMEANLLLQEYLNMLSTSKIGLGPLTSIVNCLVSLCIMRPQLRIVVAKPLLEATQAPPLSLNDMEKQSYFRCIRSFFVAVYRASAQSPTSKIYKEAAVALGCKLQELERHTKTSKHSLNAQKKQLQPNNTVYSNTQENSVDFMEDVMPSQAHSYQDRSVIVPGNEWPQNFSLDSLSLEQVADIVLQAISSTNDAQFEQILTFITSTQQGQKLTSLTTAQKDQPQDATNTTPSHASSNIPTIPVKPSGDTAIAPIPSNDDTTICTPDELEAVSNSPEVDSENMFIELLNNIINADDYYSKEIVSALAQEYDPNALSENYDRRNTICAMKLGWYLLGSKLSVTFVSSIEDKYMSQKEKAAQYQMKVYEILVSYFIEDLKSSFEFMIIWLNHLWISEKRRKSHKSNTKRRENIQVGYFYWVNYILDFFHNAKLPSTNKLITKFLVEIPKVSESMIDRIAKEYCDDRHRTEIGLFVLQTLSNLRPAVRSASLSRLLEYTRHIDKHIRIPAILMCKRLYVANEEIASEIERYSLKSVYKLLSEYPARETSEPSQDRDKRDDEARGSSEFSTKNDTQQLSLQEQDIIRDKAIAYTELYFVLCSIKQELSTEIFKLYKNFSREAQRGIEIALDPLIKSLSSRPGRLMELVKNFPGDSNFIAELARTAIENKDRGSSHG